MYRDQFGEFVCGYIRGTKQKPYMDSCTTPVGRTSADHATTTLNDVLNLEIHNIDTFL